MYENSSVDGPWKMVRAAMGEIPCDLTVCNIQLVNMFPGRFTRPR